MPRGPREHRQHRRATYRVAVRAVVRHAGRTVREVLFYTDRRVNPFIRDIDGADIDFNE